VLLRLHINYVRKFRDTRQFILLLGIYIAVSNIAAIQAYTGKQTGPEKNIIFPLLENFSASFREFGHRPQLSPRRYLCFPWCV